MERSLCAARYLKAFDLFVLPSRKEGLPYALLEAGFATLPVVATLVGGVPDIIEHGKTGLLVRPGNMRELKDAIEWHLTHPKEATDRAESLRQKVSREFSFERAMLPRTLEVYSSRRM